MPTFPTGTQYRPRGDIQGAVMEFDPSKSSLVARDILPPFQVPEAAGVIPFTPKAYGSMIPNMRRNSDGSYTRSEGEQSALTYATEEFAHERRLDRRKAAVYRSWFDFEVIEARTLYWMMRRREEKDLFDYLFNTSNFTLSGNTGVTVGTSWATAASATPIANFGTALALKKTQTGMQFNTAIFTWTAWMEMSRTAEFLDRVKYTRTDAANLLAMREIVASAIGVEQVLIADAPYNTAEKGQAASFSQIANTDYVGLANCARTGNIDEPCLGRTFFYTGDGAGLEVAETYASEERRSDILRVRQDIQQNKYLTDFFYLIKIHP